MQVVMEFQERVFILVAISLDFLLSSSVPFSKFLFYVGVQLINNVLSVSGVQESVSVIHIHVSILFQILFPFRLLQNIEQSSPCYTVGSCCLSILDVIVCIYQLEIPSPSLSFPHKFSFLMCLYYFAILLSVYESRLLVFLAIWQTRLLDPLFH